MINNLIHNYKEGLKEYIETFFDSIGLYNYEFKDIHTFESEWDVNFEMFIEALSNDWSVTLQLKRSEKEEDNFIGRIFIYAYEKFMGLTNYSYSNTKLNISRPEDLKAMLLEDSISKYLQAKNNPIEWWFGHEGIDFIGPEGYTLPNIDMLNVVLNYVQTQEYEDLIPSKNIYKLIILKIQHDEFSYSFALKINNHICWIFLPFFMGSPGTTNFYMNKIDSQIEEINKKYPNSIKIITIHQPFSKIEDFINKYYSIGHSSDINSRDLNSPRMLIKDDKFWSSFINHTLNKSEGQYWDCKEIFHFWMIPPENRDAKRKNEIKATSNIISFANADGGVIFIGISDKLPRKINGVENIEDKKNSIIDLLIKYSNCKRDLIKFHEFNWSNGKSLKKILILIIQQSREIIVVNVNDIDHRIPVRIGAKTIYKNYKDLKIRPYTIKKNNIDFIRELYQLFNS